MNDEGKKVYFNAVRTVKGCHLFAVGWTPSPGWEPILEPDGDAGNFKFRLKETGNTTIMIPQPFQLALGIVDPPRSVTVRAEGKNYHVLVKDIKGTASSTNTSGDWVDKPVKK